MTEAEWLAYNRARPLLNFLRGRTTDRKLRLFACGCWRMWPTLHVFPDANQLVELMERFTDGESVSFDAIAFSRGSFQSGIRVIRSVNAHSAACRVCRELGKQQNGWLARDIFGNPFRPVSFAESWRSETAVALATAIYVERAFDRLPILADALEEAGCDHTDVLSHCRGPGPHVRGCWVVDLVLGKE